jgi:hypothetical protein
LYVCGQNSKVLNRIRIKQLSPILLLIALGCAKIGSPYGGLKDETPPKVIKTKPPEKSTHFVPQKKIIITFDEYIQLQNIFQEMIISPPIDGTILAQVKGKSLVVEFPEEAVFDTTTYTLSFGNAIMDNNESNVLKNYEYVFSLKGHIDTMNVEGRIVSAFNHQPDKDRMYVMLYKNLADSAPLLEKPRYICRADEQGYFSMHNLETGVYRAFALKDANSNMLFDLPNEQIAFSDSLIELTPEKLKADSITSDSTLFKQFAVNDTTSVDSTAIADSLKKMELPYAYHADLFYFTQVVKNQYLKNNLRSQPDRLFFSFNQTLTDSVSIFPLNITPQSSNWYLLDENRTKDTLIYWLTDTAMISFDSLQMEICYPTYDSSAQLYFARDTFLMLAQKEKATTVRGRKGKTRNEEESLTEQPKKPTITLKNNIKKAGAFDLDKKIIITTPTPTFILLKDKIKLFRVQDTLEFPVKFEVTRDTASFYKFNIDYQPMELTSYRLFIPDSTFIDIYGVTQDTTEIHFKTQEEDFYGTVNIHVKNVKSAIVLQLMDEKENVLKESVFNTDQDLRYAYLYPKKYMLKVIVDENGNGKWDSGNYIQHIQPEKVIYYPQPVEVRSNWEMDFIWELEY